jgi:hypothetical protein
MQQLYARVFTQILDSSLAEDWQARHVFEDLLKLADGGIVEMTRQAISRRTNVPMEVINRAIDVLESPDPASRDAAEDGRRLVRLDEHRDWGWRIVNWDKYDAIRSAQDQRAKTAKRTREWRERQKVSPAPLPKAKTKTEADTEAEARSQERHTPSQGVTNSKRLAGARPASKVSDDEWLASLKKDKAYQGIDVGREHAKMLRWCEVKHKSPSRQRFVNWLNRIDPPLSTSVGTNSRPCGELPMHTETQNIDPSKL